MTRKRLLITNSFGRLDDGGLLIHSPSRWSETVYDHSRWFAYYPFMLATLSSSLKNTFPDFVVHLFDGCLLKLNKHEFQNKVRNFKADYVFVEPAFQVAEEVFNLLNQLKKEENFKILAGGTHASTCPEKVLSQGADKVFSGYYINSVKDFFLHREGSEVIHYSNDIGFNNFLLPENNDIKRVSYASPGEPASEFRAIQAYATRGCMGGCSFCVARHIYYQKPVHEIRDSDLVVKEVEQLIGENPAVEGVFFDEEDHFYNDLYIKELSEKIIARNIKIRIEALGRIDRLNENNFPLMKKAGYEKVRVGIETFDEKVQKINGKHLPFNMIKSKLIKLQAAGIKVHASFQVGLPGATKDTDLRTIKMVTDLIRKELLASVQISIFTPFKGTPAYKKLFREGAIRDISPDSFNGGLKCVVDRDNYPAHEVEAVFKFFIRQRDHYFLKQQIKSKGLLVYLSAKLKKMGLIRFSTRFAIRLLAEFKYLLKV